MLSAGRCEDGSVENRFNDYFNIGFYRFYGDRFDAVEKANPRDLERSAVQLRLTGARTKAVPWRGRLSRLPSFWALHSCCSQLF